VVSNCPAQIDAAPWGDQILVPRQLDQFKKK
jgi:hypothetical protein